MTPSKPISDEALRGALTPREARPPVEPEDCEEWGQVPAPQPEVPALSLREGEPAPAFDPGALVYPGMTRGEVQAAAEKALAPPVRPTVLRSGAPACPPPILGRPPGTSTLAGQAGPAPVPTPAPAPVPTPGTGDAQVGGTHYNKASPYEPWKVMQAYVTQQSYLGYHLCSALAYLARVEQTGLAGRGGVVDVAKARHHLQEYERCVAEGLAVPVDQRLVR